MQKEDICINKYIVEIEIYEHESKRTAVMSITREIRNPIQEGHFVIINDGWHRIATVIHDSDHDKCFLHLEKRIVTEKEFHHAIQEFKLKGWKLLREVNGVKP